MSILTLSSRAGARPDQYLNAREYPEARLIGSILLRASVFVALISIIF